MRNRILKILKELGVEHKPPKSNGWVNFSCILPGHKDGSPSAGINLENGVYNCWGCHTTTNIYKIIQIYKNCTYKEALDYFNQGLVLEVHPTQNLNNRKINYREKIDNILSFNFEVLLPMNPNNYEYTDIRGFTREFCREFDISYCAKGTMRTSNDKDFNLSGYMITPIIDKEIGLQTFEARKVSEEVWGPKVIYPTNSSPNVTLFNYDNLNHDEDLIIVEGMGSIPKIWLEITKNVTCTFGSKITDHQKHLLRQFKKKKIFLSDWDRASFESLLDIKEYLENVWVFKSQTDDKDIDFIDRLKDGYIEISRFLTTILFKTELNLSQDGKMGGDK